MQRFDIATLNEKINTVPCSVALGNFDGVHLAHKALLCAAKKKGIPSAVFTFCDEVPHYLTTQKERIAEIEKEGIDFLFLVPLSLVKNLSCDEFVSFLKENLACRHLVCGFNFHFGKNAAGDSNTLLHLANAISLSCDILPVVTFQGEAVSSSRIRALLNQGNIEEANTLLGRHYSLSGIVERGYSIGKSLDVPTLNLRLTDTAAPLCHGVYASVTTVDGTVYPSITNIGNNPTFERDKITCETYLLDTVGDFYEKEIKVELLSFLREETKFSSFDKLKEAIVSDLENARRYHKTHSEI